MNGFNEEYRAVRERCGVYLCGDTAALAVTGTDRYGWLQGMVSNDVRMLEKGERLLKACILNNTGHLLSDVTLMSVSEAEAERLDIVPKSSCIVMMMPRQNLEKISRLLERFIIMEEVEICDITDRIFSISIQGPLADPGDRALSFPMDRSGSGGYDLFSSAPIDYANYGPTISQQTQELLRIEAGLPKYGADMDERTIPLEANLESTHISLNKGCYVGQEIISRINSRGHTNRRLIGIVVESGEISVGDVLVPVDDVGRDAGWISSVAMNSPAEGGKTIALATIRHEYSEAGYSLCTKTTGSICTVHELPFYKR